MTLPDFSLRNQTTVIFAMVLLLLGGIWGYFRLGKLEDPVFTVKTAMVMTVYPGASPHEVEQQVTRPIEEAVQGTDEVYKVRSESRAGLSLVYVDLNEWIRSDDLQQLWDMLRRKVTAVQSQLPDGALPSEVMDDYGDVYGLFMALSADGYSLAELKEYADYIRRELMLVPDVERITFYGIQPEVVTVDVSRAKCASLGIPPTRIASMLQAQNTMAPAGAMDVGSLRVRIQPSGAFASVDEIGALVIQGEGDEQVLLKDLATITREYLDPAEPMMRFNGKAAIGIAASAADGANVVTMGEAVNARLGELMAGLPVGIELNKVYYQSDFVKDKIKGFMINLAESVAIVIGVLLVTMGLRSGLIIAANLVLSIMGTFLVMLVWGIDVQKISLAALILVMGMIVDNAIVVADAGLVNLQKGMTRLDAIAEPTRQSAVPLLGATVIACLAFFPNYMAPTNTGEFCASLFQVVAIALMFSWLLAMSQTPVFCYRFLTVPEGKGGEDLHAGAPYRLYKRLLNKALRHRLVTLGLMVGLLVLAGAGMGMVEKRFFADADTAQFVVDYRRPEGSRIDMVSEDLKIAESFVLNMEGVTGVATCVGQGPPRFMNAVNPEPKMANYGQLIINVDDYRKISAMMDELAEWFAINLPGGEPHITKYISGPKADYRVEARFTGPDPAVLRSLAEQARAVMADTPNAINITDDWRERSLVWEALYAQNKGRRAGVERTDLARDLLGGTDGVTVTSYREHDELIPVKVVYSSPDQTDFSALPVWGISDAGVPVAQVTEGSDFFWEDPVIRRYNRRRVIRAQCDPAGTMTSDTLLQKIRPRVEAIPLPAGYTLEWEGEYELSTESNEGLNAFLPVSLVAMVMILVGLFNGIRQPLMIITILPLALVGMAAGLLIFGQPFGFLAVLGAYSLIGMMIKNAVVLIDLIDEDIRGGKDPLAAVKEASVNRMRPVMMASVTTIFGMIPLIFDVMFVSMAVTIMVGLAFATVLTLVVIPVLYTLFFKIRTDEMPGEVAS
ncbi:efflux RND transporter permease subunit [Desulfoluna spongiiphila]|uniref:efflux RND transporter permease subunit n=1 Tax=Desulfoluna spongiiphila TaxID=419481 RepID=UPI001258318D|nr:efflux RND transporter permease subunit [Desulfoluna spongiiphila]VVS91121.1 acriflavin resistance protein [Desulfoluna spongiiphila]